MPASCNGVPQLGVESGGPGPTNDSVAGGVDQAEAAGRGTRIMMGKIKDPRYADEEVWAKMRYARTRFDRETGTEGEVCWSLPARLC